MRKINKIIIHCSDSDHILHNSIHVIKKWHLARGFNDVGYHKLILRNGDAQGGRPISKQGAHVKGENEDSIGICVHGKTYFTKDQFRGLAKVITQLAEEHSLEKNFIFGHNDFTDLKTCPNFNVDEFITTYLPKFAENGRGRIKAAAKKSGASKGTSRKKPK